MSEQARPSPSAGAVSAETTTVAPPSPQPTPVVTPSEADRRQPAGTAAGESGPAAAVAKVNQTVQQTSDERPEVLVGAAFAGGFLFALILKRLGR